jgi:hypothetical protein
MGLLVGVWILVCDKKKTLCKYKNFIYISVNPVRNA